MFKASKLTRDMLQALQAHRHLQRERVATLHDPGAEIARVQSFHAQRLKQTHAEDWQQAHYAPALDFFLEELYTDPNANQRDLDFEKIFPMMQRVLPDAAVATMLQAAQLQALTHLIDVELANHLAEAPMITPAAYQQAYQQLPEEYVLDQLAHVIDLGEQLNRLVHARLIGAAIKVAGGPAKLMGFQQLHGWIQRGFNAFKKVPDAERWLQQVKQREMDVYKALRSGAGPETWWTESVKSA